MAGLSRAPASLHLKKPNSFRPPTLRPSAMRIQSSTSSLNARLQTGTLSPAECLASASNATSRSGSPSSRQNGGMKRKERDFDGDGEESNIHVVVRCRGRNDRELRENSGVVVSTDGAKGKNVELSMGPSALSNKTYHFDKVFSPAADQAMIYEDVVTPILDEVRATTLLRGLQFNSSDRCSMDITALSLRTGRLALVNLSPSHSRLWAF